MLYRDATRHSRILRNSSICSFACSNTHRPQFPNFRVRSVRFVRDTPQFPRNWNEETRNCPPSVAFVYRSPSIFPSEHDFPSKGQGLLRELFRDTGGTQPSRLFSEPSLLFAVSVSVLQNRCARVSRIFHSPLTPENPRAAEN